jgi:hypothetical protein
MELLTTAQVAALKGVSVRTIQRRVLAGLIPCSQKLPGTGGYLFDLEQILPEKEAS